VVSVRQAATVVDTRETYHTIKELLLQRSIPDNLQTRDISGLYVTE
jgi:hypothetical protein